MIAIGQRIKQLLDEKKLSQKEMAEGTGIPGSTLSELIQGKKEPGISKARRIAEYLNVDLHWLVVGEPFSRGSYTARVSESDQSAGYAASDPAYPAEIREAIALMTAMDAEERQFVLEMIRRIKQKP